jgi:hypothetical protein
VLEKQKAQGWILSLVARKTERRTQSASAPHKTREKIAESVGLSTSVLCSMSQEREIR